MGIFGGLFDKKECDICGGKIGLLGNRKLEDGNCCKDCAKKLSPWFSDRRNSTVAEINEQLAYREANKQKVAEFKTTLSFGEDMKLLIDEDARLFMVTRQRNLIEANPDVLSLADVTGCVLDIDEDKTEDTHEDSNGNEVSYNPPRYIYEYDFYVTIQVRNPYFDEMRFKLNDSSVRIESGSGMPMARGRQMLNSDVVAPRTTSPTESVEYKKYKDMGEEIKAALMNARQEARTGGNNEANAPEAPKTPVACPSCGATVVPDDKGCCEYCGGLVVG